MQRKYSLVETDFKIVCGVKLFRIKAEISFQTKFTKVNKGDLGGYIEKETNLEQSGNAWVYGDARVYGDAWVSGNACLLWISKIGSRDDTVTFFKAKAGIKVSCGCFSGTLQEFEEKVKETHKNNEHAKAYKLAIQLAKLRIDLKGEKPCEK
jgi:hypothetical protein